MVSKDIEILNPASNIAIATLWTKKGVVVERLRELGLADKVNIVGTLYTKYGINYLFHTLSQNPRIDVLILFGADIMGSGEALAKLFRGEVDTGLNLLWSPDELRGVLSTVRLVDLREDFVRGDWQKLVEAVIQSFNPNTYRERPRLALREAEVASWPRQTAGLYVQEKSIFRAWVKLVDAVMTWGFVKGSEYNERQKQLLGASVVLNYSQQIYDGLLGYFSMEELERQARSILEGEEGVAYTYGERLRKHPQAGDQVRLMVEKLAASPSTRRALAVTWDFSRDPTSEDPPCLVLLHGDLSGDYFNLVAFFRSHDAYSAWPVNAYGLARLMEHISGELMRKTGRRVTPGVLTIYSSSLHVYEHDWTRASELVRKHFERARSEFVEDNKGNFLIKVEGGEIAVELRTPEGLLAKRVSGRTAPEVLLRINLGALMPEHAAYLAREIFRAEQSLRSGTYYVQEEA
jgi:thymidylate synthase